MTRTTRVPSPTAHPGRSLLLAVALSALTALPVLPVPPATARTPAVPGTTGTADPAVPAPVVREIWQGAWNAVMIDLVSTAPGWTLRSCPTDQDPVGEVLARGTGSQAVTVRLAEVFDWELVDAPPVTTFCGLAVADDGAGGTSAATRTTVDVDFTPYVTAMTYDTECPWDKERPVGAGTWHRARFRARRPLVRGGELLGTLPVPGVPVEARLRTRRSDPWTSLGTFTSDADGYFYVGYRHDNDTEVQVCRPGTGCATEFDWRWYQTYATVRATSVPVVGRRKNFPVYATVLPRYGGRPVHLYEHVASGGLRLLSTRKTSDNGTLIFWVPSGTDRGVRTFELRSPAHNHVLGNFWGPVPVLRVRVL